MLVGGRTRRTYQISSAKQQLEGRRDRLGRITSSNKARPSKRSRRSPFPALHLNHRPTITFFLNHQHHSKTPKFLHLNVERLFDLSEYFVQQHDVCVGVRAEREQHGDHMVLQVLQDLDLMRGQPGVLLVHGVHRGVDQAAN